MKQVVKSKIVFLLFLGVFSAEVVNADDLKLNYDFSRSSAFTAAAETTQRDSIFNSSSLGAIEMFAAFYSGLAVLSPEGVGGAEIIVSLLLLAAINEPLSTLPILSIGVMNAWELKDSKYSSMEVFGANFLAWNLYFLYLDYLPNKASLRANRLKNYYVFATEKEFKIQYAIRF